jgi:pyruvate,orthophosphate dikinase
MPKAYKQLRQITTRLEKHYRDVQDFEFTIQDEELFMLQTRNGKRTGYAAVMIAIDLVTEGLIKPKDAVLMVEPEALSQLLSPIFDPKTGRRCRWRRRACRHRPAPRRASGGLHGDDAVEWSSQGKQVMLVRKETVPDDIHGMFVAQGILTATGGMTSHAAVVGRQMGKPSIVGAGALQVDERPRPCASAADVLQEGDVAVVRRLSGEVKVGRSRRSRARSCR